VLEAVSLASASDPLRSLRHLASRTPSAVRWLFWRAGEGRACTLEISTESATRSCRLLLSPDTAGVVSGELSDRRAVPGASARSAGVFELRDDGGSYKGVSRWEHPTTLVEFAGREASPLVDLYSRVVERGRARQVRELISVVLPGSNDLQILTESGSPVLHIVWDTHSVPVTLAGDGIVTLVRLVLELSAVPAGLVLLEEPEVHQHPRAIRQSSRAIWAAVDAGLQVLLTTHSLELLDSLIVEATDLPRLALYRLVLQSGELRNHRLTGPEVQFARQQIEDDLR
jgi:hypothetical protein